MSESLSAQFLQAKPLLDALPQKAPQVPQVVAQVPQVVAQVAQAPPVQSVSVESFFSFSNPWLWLLIAILVVGGGGLAYWFYNKKKSTSSNANKENDS
jgi:hypothetical protein